MPLKSVPKEAIFVLAVFLAVFFGGLGAVTYPSWYQSLPFKGSVPAFLRPSTQVVSSSQAASSEKIVRTVEESAVTDTVQKDSPAVVSILAETINFDPQKGPVRSEQGIGTGFIIDPSGIVLTNDHVVSDTSISYTVLTKDNKKYKVEKIDRDASNDFAILKISGKDLPSLKLGDSSSLKVGQDVIAIGNALGRFTNTVTTGVVSGIGRGITASDSTGLSQETLDNVIQTDAALNPGNSGGPLLNLAGQVVGINFAVSQDAQNIGFVIPINTLKPVIDQYKKTGKIIKPYLGISYEMIGQDIASVQGIPQGAFVRQVLPGTTAESAGIHSGDIITKIDDQAVTESEGLAQILGK